MLKFNIRNQTISRVDSFRPAADSIDYLTASFQFLTDDWAGLSKWAHFRKDDTTYDIELTDDAIGKDKHLNLSDGVWAVYLHGTSADGMRITTAECTVTVEKSGVLNGQPLPDLPLTAEEQLEQKANNAVKVAQSVRDDADAGKFNGKTGAQGLPGKDGRPGTPGKTPEKGVDYWTPEDEAKLNTAAEAKQTADRAFSLAQTNEEDIRVNEIDITALKNTAVLFKNDRVADANQFTTRAGFAKTGDTTKNLPVSGMDAWGIILYLPENTATTVGVQIFLPVDKAKKGTLWTRTVNRSAFTPWRQLAMNEDLTALRQEVQSAKSEITSLKSADTKHTNDIAALRQEIEQIKQQINPKMML